MELLAYAFIAASLLVVYFIGESEGRRKGREEQIAIDKQDEVNKILAETFKHFSNLGTGG